jgi:glyoxylase-like metal-dependent hydrolase (beta-lactamase superfamily II)
VIIERLVLTSAESNCYIVGCEWTRQALIVDPGDDAAGIAARLADCELRASLVLITHAHWDHVNAAGALARDRQVPVALHPADLPLLAGVPDVTRERIGQPGPEPPRVDRLLGDRQELQVGELHMRVLHTPGHTPGSVCLLSQPVDNDQRALVLFSGDTLMAGWVGRTDRPGGDQQAIRASLWDRLLRLPDETRVYAGHLDPTTIGVERHDNPYLNGQLPLR